MPDRRTARVPSQPSRDPSRKIRRVAAILLAGACVLGLRTASPSKPLKPGDPKSVGMDADVLKGIDAAVEEALDQGSIPGCVVLVARKNTIVWEKAYGRRALLPEEVANSLDTIYDFASLTKPVATATAIALLVDDGKLSLDDPVVKYLPAFAQKGKTDVTIRHLLTHVSGLKAYLDMAAVAKEHGEGPDPDVILETICALPKNYKTGKGQIYSCLNFVTLCRIAEAVAGEPMHAFLKKRVWRPLGMKDTGYLLTEEQRRRAAPTRPDGSFDFCGRVHDPLARYTITDKHACGNAGLFATARDLAAFAQMILNRGEYNGVRILKPETVDLFTSVQTPPDVRKRGLGWDIDSTYAYLPRGDVIPAETSFGHTGFTGTSLWIDKKSETFVIVLANRTHTKNGSVGKLRRAVATAVGRSIDLYAEKTDDNPPASTVPQTPKRGSPPQ
jgi:CubicO group peptidase (beta-lactamase class C family)